jgi:hypothetical protein
MIERALAVPSSWLPASAHISGAVDVVARSRNMQFLNLLRSSARDAARIPQNIRQGMASSSTLLKFIPI